MDKSKVKKIVSTVLTWVLIIGALVAIGIIGNWITVLLALCLMVTSFVWGAAWKVTVAVSKAMQNFYNELLNSDLLKGKTVKYEFDKLKQILSVSLEDVK